MINDTRYRLVEEVNAKRKNVILAADVWGTGGQKIQLDERIG